MVDHVFSLVIGLFYRKLFSKKFFADYHKSQEGQRIKTTRNGYAVALTNNHLFIFCLSLVLFKF